MAWLNPLLTAPPFLLLAKDVETWGKFRLRRVGFSGKPFLIPWFLRQSPKSGFLEE